MNSKQQRKTASYSALFVALAGGFLAPLATINGHLSGVSGVSMLPNLGPGVTVNRAINEADLKRSSVFSMWWRDDVLVKRVIGLPGDEVTLLGESIYVRPGGSGQYLKLIESYETVSLGKRARRSPIAYRVPSGSLFVLGDNRPASTDSRQRYPRESAYVPIAHLLDRPLLYVGVQGLTWVPATERSRLEVVTSPATNVCLTQRYCDSGGLQHLFTGLYLAMRSIRLP